MWSGRGVREISDLTNLEFEAFSDSLSERVRYEQWSQNTELLAQSVDLLGAILAQLQAGILTAQPKDTKRFGRADYPERVRRPDWVGSAEPEPDEVVVSPGGLAQILQGL